MSHFRLPHELLDDGRVRIIPAEFRRGDEQPTREFAQKVHFEQQQQRIQQLHQQDRNEGHAEEES